MACLGVLRSATSHTVAGTHALYHAPSRNMLLQTYRGAHSLPIRLVSHRYKAAVALDPETATAQCVCACVCVCVCVFVCLCVCVGACACYVCVCVSNAHTIRVCAACVRAACVRTAARFTTLAQPDRSTHCDADKFLRLGLKGPAPLPPPPRSPPLLFPNTPRPLRPPSFPHSPAIPPIPLSFQHTRGRQRRRPPWPRARAGLT